MAGERCSSHASAIWPGVALWCCAMRASGELGLASRPAASGYQGMTAIPPPAQISTGLPTSGLANCSSTGPTRSRLPFGPAKVRLPRHSIRRCSGSCPRAEDRRGCRSILRSAPGDRQHEAGRARSARAAASAGCPTGCPSSSRIWASSRSRTSRGQSASTGFEMPARPPQVHRRQRRRCCRSPTSRRLRCCPSPI
jgi:hypothetical protein